jgi:hypothetical protein
MSPEELVLIDSTEDQPIALVAFTGAMDKMAIPISEFFGAVRAPCHRILVRQLALPILGHQLGDDVRSAATALNSLLAGRPALFVGHSLGAMPALILGTLCEADAVLVVNPTTSLLPDNLSAWNDRRYESTRLQDDVLQEFGDIPRLWSQYSPVRTHVHFGYRDVAHRGHAEHVAEFDQVDLTAYYQYQPMYELLRTERLAGLIHGLLSEVAVGAVERLCATSGVA